MQFVLDARLVDDPEPATSLLALAEWAVTLKCLAIKVWRGFNQSADILGPKSFKMVTRLHLPALTPDFKTSAEI